jgi:hypothetical protein
MTSVLAGISQVPARVGYFRANPTSGEGVVAQLMFNELLDFSAATGFVSKNGNIVTFNTYANAQAALTDGTTPNGTALVAGQFFRDMGKSIHIEVPTNGIPVRVATLTKVQKYLDGQATEGVTGVATLSPAASGNGYFTGYVVTYSANPSDTVGVPVSVSRVGY